MRTAALCIIVLALSLLETPEAAAANIPGASCTAFGTTLLSDDHKNIVACLCPDVGACVKTGGGTNTIWKAMSHSLPEAIPPFQAFNLNASNSYAAYWYNNTQRNAAAVLSVCAGGTATRDTTLTMKTGGYPAHPLDGYRSLFSGMGRGSAFLIVPPGYYLRGDVADSDPAAPDLCNADLYIWVL